MTRLQNQVEVTSTEDTSQLYILITLDNFCKYICLFNIYFYVELLIILQRELLSILLFPLFLLLYHVQLVCIYLYMYVCVCICVYNI